MQDVEITFFMIVTNRNIVIAVSNPTPVVLPKLLLE